MQRIDAIAEAILRREGQFLNDPDHPCGATGPGVVIGTPRSPGRYTGRDGGGDAAERPVTGGDTAGRGLPTGPVLRSGMDRRLRAVLTPVTAGVAAGRIGPAPLEDAGLGPLARAGAAGPRAAGATTCAAAVMRPLLVERRAERIAAWA